jgi:hypothetical protein
MNRRLHLALLLSILAAPAIALAQHAAVARPNTKPPAEAGEYAFLVGQWDLTVEVPAPSLAARIHGMPKLVGTWKAWRALDAWGVEDELRITDEAGNPISFGQTVRVYDAAARRWSLSTLDVYRARFSAGESEWRGGEMHLTAQGIDREGRPYKSRSRYFEITPGGFRFQQDRSTDDGKTWTEGALRIAAKRAAATATR